MKVLLDTNIVIHRETSPLPHADVGVLFRWLDNLHYVKCIHPITVDELAKYKDKVVAKVMPTKLSSYTELKTSAPLSDEVQAVSDEMDTTQSDLNDTVLINELFNGRVEILITEDRNLLCKAESLGLSGKVYTIDAFLEKVSAENPDLADYKVLAVQKELFGNLDAADEFFESLKADYGSPFDDWMNRKADEPVYVCHHDGKLMALLYLKVEDETEDYSDINPMFSRKKRLKIGTFKVALNGFRLGERFLRIIFDNAIRQKVEEIYVTIFDRSIDQIRLIKLLEAYGFTFHGYKGGDDTGERVYVRDFSRVATRHAPRTTYPYISTGGRIFLVPIYPGYHTELLPDSILKTESSSDFVENEPHRNAISKVYICRSFERSLNPGDVVVFYRTGGYYKSVVTTIGIVECVITDIPDEAEFIRLCRKRTVFSPEDLSKHWRYNKYSRPFITNFLYAYSLPKRPNMKKLIELGVIADVDSAPRGFTEITVQNLKDILTESQSDESIAVDTP